MLDRLPPSTVAPAGAPIRCALLAATPRGEQIVRLRVLTHDYAAPDGACETWRSLMRACRKLDRDLNEHMRLENEVLFAPFLR